MADEINFRVDSFQSGSISFGRFESEALCWERRSSFSHNRYLEEVEKCSKPGSVTEKKAYFEAHFRKKGIRVLSSPECPNEKDHNINENDITEMMCNDEEIDHTNPSIHSAQFDQSMDGSVQRLDNQLTECETDVFGPQLGDGNSNVKVDKANDDELGSTVSIHNESGNLTEENLDCQTVDLDTFHNPKMTTDLFPDNNVNEEISRITHENQQSSLPKKNSTSKSERIKPRLVPPVSAGQSRRYTSGTSSKGSENKDNYKVWDDPVRSKAEKKTSGDPIKCLTHKITRNKRVPEKAGADKINNSAGKEPRTRSTTVMEPQRLLPLKVSGGAYQSANRVKPAVGATKPVMKRDTSRSVFKSNEHVQKKIEFDMKLKSKLHAKEAELHQLQAKTQEKAQAELKQLRKSLSSKAMPMPSYYRGSLCVPDSNKAIPNTIKSRKQHAKSSIPGTRLSGSSQLSSKAGIDQTTSTSACTKTADPPEVSGVTSCQSTLTSDSSASSSVGTCNVKPSQAGVSPTISRKKGPEKEKLTSLGRRKIPEGIQIHKRKAFDEKQKTRIERSTYASINSSSSAGHMAVGVVS